MVIALLCFILLGLALYLRLVQGRGRVVSSRLAAVLEASDSGLSVWNSSKRLTACNGRFREFYPSVKLKPGLEFEDLVRFTATRAVVLVGKRDTEKWVQDWMARFSSASCEIFMTPDERYIEVRTSPTADGETVLVYTDVTQAHTVSVVETARVDRVKTQRENLALLRAAIAIGVKGVVFHQSAREMLQLVVPWSGWDAGTIYLATKNEKGLCSTGVWFSGGDVIFSDEMKVAMDACCEEPDELLKQVLSSGATVWIGNITADPRLSEKRRQAFAEIRSVCALPVMSGDAVVAIVELFGKDAFPRDEVREEIVSDAFGQLAHVFDRERSSSEDSFLSV